VIDFEALFENYLRNTLRTHFQGTDSHVRDGNREGEKWLFDERVGPKANPDIVIEAGSPPVAIVVEVKYKDRIDRSDINQCIAYGFSYRVSVVLLVRQRRGTEPQTHVVGTIGGVKLVEYRFDLGAADLPREEQAFVRAVEANLGRGTPAEAAVQIRGKGNTGAG
jgi:5-methylcytosine-specific restriction endonuclease McrBC regulatory subunit McrC